MYVCIYLVCQLSSGVRPFGVSLLIAGFDEKTPYLFQCDPTVSCSGVYTLCCYGYPCLNYAFLPMTALTDSVSSERIF